MKIIPSLSLSNKNAVLAKEDRYIPIVDSSGKNISPGQLIDELRKHYDDAYILDIDGITRSKPHLDLIQSLSGEINIWLDSGVSDPDDMCDAFIAGATKTVIATKTIKDLGVLADCLEMSREICLCIDYDDKNAVFWRRQLPLADTIRKALDIVSDFYEDDEENDFCIVLADHSNSALEERVKLLDIIGESAQVLFANGLNEEDAGELENAGASGIIIDLEPVLGKLNII